MNEGMSEGMVGGMTERVIEGMTADHILEGDKSTCVGPIEG